jgi:hypothetical protein
VRFLGHTRLVHVHQVISCRETLEGSLTLNLAKGRGVYTWVAHCWHCAVRGTSPSVISSISDMGVKRHLVWSCREALLCPSGCCGPYVRQSDAHGCSGTHGPCRVGIHCTFPWSTWCWLSLTHRVPLSNTLLVLVVSHTQGALVTHTLALLPSSSC